jgi:feruloyl esterase
MQIRSGVAWGAFALLTMAAGGGGRAVEASAGAAECAALAAIDWPGVKITGAAAVPAAATGITVAHCRVDGVLDKEIRFQLLLPDTWNKKFMMGGGGGFVGGVDNQARASVNDGYATVGTDTGHQGAVTSAAWALNDLERQLNFGHLAVHRVAEVAKALVKAHYGAAPARSYFNGCSNGGRQALMEAQRYPDDFDGIVSGAPANDFTGIGAQFIKDIQALYSDPKNLATPLFTRETLLNVEAQIVKQCDALDGAADELLEDPRRCSVDVTKLSGITDAQRIALRAVYGETRNKDGVIFPGQPVGGEGDVAGWPSWIVGPNPLVMKTQNAPSLRFAFGTEMFKYFIFNDPAWDYSRYEFSNFRKDAAQASRILNATDPNLDAFKAKGRKLVLWHGWSDPALSALGTIKYYEQVESRDPAVRDYARLFMMPGVLHCAGGPGPDRVDWGAVIDEWVEKGQPPARVIARKMAADGAVSISRPLCPYPQRAVYSGTGSLTDEKNFVCK